MHDNGWLEVTRRTLDLTTAPSVADMTRNLRAASVRQFHDQRELKQHFLLLGLHPEPALIQVHATVLNDYTAERIGPAVRAIAGESRARALWMISEVWHAWHYDGDGSYPYATATEDPKRTEGVLLTSEAIGRVPPVEMWFAPIERNKGRPKLLDWKPFHDAGKLGGRMLYLLPPESYGAGGKA